MTSGEPTPPTLPELRAAAMRLLGSREHTRRQLADKLVRRFAQSESLIEQVLDDLACDGLQSDQRYCEQLARSRKSRGYGPLRIRHDLEHAGISRAEAEAWIDEERAFWRARALEQARRRIGQERPDQKSLQRVARHLSQRGFGSDIVAYVLDQLRRSDL